MSRNWLIVEKAVAIFLIIWGGFFLYLNLYTLNESVSIFYRSHYLEMDRISYLKIFKNWHLSVFIPLSTITGGILLLLNKRVGWILSLIGIISCIPLNWNPKRNDNIQINVPLLICCYSFFLLALAILLLWKPFRKKYNPTAQTWIIISIIVCLIILDKLFV